MRAFILAVCISGLLAACGGNGDAGPDREVTAYVGGYWFDGDTFVDGPLYVEGDRIIAEPGDATVTEVDTGGGYLVPAYGDAHIHGTTNPDHGREDMQALLTQGVFYAMDHDTAFPVTEDYKAYIAQPGTLDVKYTNGVLLTRDSAVATFYADMLPRMGGRDVDNPDALDTVEVYFMETAEDVAEKWPLVTARDIDFVKVIMSFSDEYELRHNNPEYRLQTGISPDLLPGIVRRTHDDGRRVSVHIENAYDFRMAAQAGADLIAHIPASWRIDPGEGMMATGYEGTDITPFLLTDEDLAPAIENQPVVITTTMSIEDHESYGLFSEAARANLSRLTEAGIPLALGSDGRGTLREARHIQALTGMGNLDVLRLLSETTPQVIYPDRAVGRLSPGNEANFLVLAASPLQSLEHLDDITFAVKAGQPLNLTGTEGDGASH